jgi:hypothetical protein
LGFKHLSSTNGFVTENVTIFLDALFDLDLPKSIVWCAVSGEISDQTDKKLL